MQKLHLVGFTTDQKGLILSARRGARSGSFHLTVDEDLAEAVQDLRAKQVEEEAEAIEEAGAARPARVESALSVREIQARLRHGRTVADVAKAAGVDAEWVDRFATPVFAERAQVISRVHSLPLKRARLGPSEHPIGESIRRNLADRGVSVTPEEFAEGWSARQLADGRWAVRFRYHHRNKDHVLRFDLDDSAGTLVAADRASGQLGYITPKAPKPAAAPPRPRQTPAPPAAERRPPKRATVTVGFRPDDAPGAATSVTAKERERANDAMRKAAALRAAEAEKAAARRAKEKAEQAARLEREERAAEARRQREARAQEARKARELAAKQRAKEAAERKKAAAAKQRAAERAKAKAAKQRADQARRAEAALRAAERKAVAARKAKAAAKKAKATSTKKAKAAAKRPVSKATRAATSKARATKPPPAKTSAARSPAPKAASRPAPRPAAKPAPAAVKASRPKKAPAPAKATAPAPAPAPAPARAPEAPSDRPPFMAGDTTGDVRILGPAPRPAEERLLVPSFRPDLAESARRAGISDDEVRTWVDDEPSPGNGLARERAPGERRTRPLRAT